MSNSNAIYNLNGVPLFTYGMIGITTIVLAVVTMMDTDNNSFAKDEGYDKTLQPTTETKKEESMLGNMFGSSTAEPTTETKKEESMFGNMFGSTTTQPTVEPTAQPTTGGKYGHRKTKHNKRQNTYTRKH